MGKRIKPYFNAIVLCPRRTAGFEATDGALAYLGVGKTLAEPRKRSTMMHPRPAAVGGRDPIGNPDSYLSLSTRRRS